MADRIIHDVLVLTTSWVPVHIVVWDKAINLLLQDKAHALDKTYFAYSFDDWKNYSCSTIEDYCWIHGVSITLALPEIIVLTKFDHLPQNDVKYSRQNVFARDNHQCAYCGKHFAIKNLTVDHIIPRSKGGLTTWDNVVTCCISCNQTKANKTLAEAHMALKVRPHKPKWFHPLDGRYQKKKYCKTWEHFMRKIDISIPTSIK